ncbi:MAG: WG repeat-containing protein [Clostridia bacterium]|nr:WG repeat-containing protein [Clostridia bacterium]
MTTCTANQLEAKKAKFVFCDWMDTNIVQNLVKIRNAGLFGLVDLLGQVVCACKYDEIEELQDGYFKVSKKGSWGVITSSGEEVFPCSASTIYYVENGRVICGMDDDVYSIKLKEAKKDSVG